MTLLEQVEDVLPLFEAQGRLVELPRNAPIVFVGDTHGDLDATERVLARFLDGEHVLVLLGDTVDRGPNSEENLKLVLETKRAHPETVFLLMGNHEAWGAATFSPADFWNSLDTGTAETLAAALLRLPFAAHHPSGVLAVHGAIPNLRSLDEIANIEPGSDAWRAITWGDFYAEEKTSVGGRPGFDRLDFESRSERLGIQTLVRSHQPSAPKYLFDNRCLTLFTSSAYGDTERSVARLKPGIQLRTAHDLELIGI